MILKYICLYAIGIWVLAMQMSIINKLDPTDTIPSWVQGIIGAVWMLYIIKSYKLEKEKHGNKTKNY